MPGVLREMLYRLSLFPAKSCLYEPRLVVRMTGVPALGI